MFVFQFLNLAFAQCPDFQPQKQVFWGDLHVHTVHSLDAALQGTLVTHQQAYDFALGNDLYFRQYGEGVSLSRPLDFVAITDHAEFLGETEICTDSTLSGYSSYTCKLYRNNPKLAFIILNGKLSQRPRGTPASIKRLRMCNNRKIDCLQPAEKLWQQMNTLANQNNTECSFTTFPAYEWSSSPKLANLHRNVIFQDEHTPSRPVSYFDSPTASQLWSSLDQQCTGECKYLTIPHNSNLSAGKMFLPYREEDKQELIEYAQQRAEHEPLVEIFQHKGSAECYPTQSDEECSFEYIPFNNLIADRYKGLLTKKPSEQDFVRWALKEGLLYESNGLPNPYRLGFVASTDTHLGTPGMVAEDKFIGHGGAGRSSEHGLVDSPYFNPGGLTAVWAEENSREALFSGLQQREVYGTSGPRITLRLFATSTEITSNCGSVKWLEEAYEKGVPMGGEIAGSSELYFHILAQRDPLSQPLDSIQLIKGWLSEDQPQEQIYSLDVPQNKDAYCLSWQDPNPTAETAFYYARVLESPSVRWSKESCQYVPCPNAIPQMIQERAWSSPIWITPPQ